MINGSGQGGTLRLKNKGSIPDYFFTNGNEFRRILSNRAVVFEPRIDAFLLVAVFTNIWESTKERSSYLTELSKISNDELNVKLE